MKKILNNKKGFTLIELIIVIAVIAILAAIAIPSFIGIIDSAEKTEATALARNSFSLAQIELLNDQLDGDTATTDFAAVGTAAGLGAGDKLVITPDANDPFTVASAQVTTAKGWVATATNGGVEVDAE